MLLPSNYCERINFVPKISAELIRRINNNLIDIALIQEPYQTNNEILMLNTDLCTLIYDNKECKPRTCILINKNIKHTALVDFCSGDETAISITFEEGKGGQTEIILCSAYFPGDSALPPPSASVASLVQYCKNSRQQLIIGTDANAHHENWCSTDTNQRGIDVMDFILQNNLEICNVGNDPTFVTSARMEVLDITLCTQFIKNKIRNWRVSKEPSSSDHSYIEFEIHSLNQKTQTYRNPKKTNFDNFRAELSTKIGSVPLTYHTIADLDSAALALSQAIIESYEASCPLKTKTSNRDCPWFTPRLAKLKKLTRRLWNQSKKKFRKGLFCDPVVELYRQTLKTYNKEVNIAKALSWRLNCEEIEKVEESSRLHKLLSKGPTRTLGAVKKHDGSYTKNVNETLDTLLKTHFPESQDFTNTSDNLQEEIPGDFQLANQIVTKRKLDWAIHTFKPFKSPGRDGIFPKLLQEGFDILQPHLTSLFKASISSGFIPKVWRGVRVTFLPKPGRVCYTEAKSFRPISLMSFILKALEKLVDRFIRDTALTSKPLHKNQHAYQAGKSTESALHSLVTKLEQTLDNKEFGLAVFLDIEGAFDNTSFETIVNASTKHGVHHSLTRWMYNMLKTREITATLFDESKTIFTTRGCPQGGCLSCLMWSLVVNSLLDELNNIGGVWAQGYADDIVIFVTGKFINTVHDITQKALNTVAKWCVENGLSVHPDKTTAVPFTKKRKLRLSPLKLKGAGIPVDNQVKYLGVILDSKLTWNPHLTHIKTKCTKSFWTCRRMVGSNWGLKPKITHWLYTQVILPRITYASIVWWHKAKQKTAQNTLNTFQRMALLSITGAMRTTPTAALEVLLDLPPLHLKIEEVARSAAFRLASIKLWSNFYKLSGHTKLNRILNKDKELWKNSDRLINTYNFDRPFKVFISERQNVDADDYSERDDRITCFTDGSKSDTNSGSGVYVAKFDINLSVNVGQNATVFQAELTAIKLCADELLSRDIRNNKILICSDSQAALKSLINCKIRSQTVWNCLQTLQALGAHNEVTLMWVPGHCGIEGNERADELAGQNVDHSFTNLTLPVSQCLVKTKLKLDTHIKFEKLWSNKTDLRQSKEMIKKPDKKRTLSLLLLHRNELRQVINFVTGHAHVQYHMKKMNLTESSTCRLCGHTEETTRHILCECPALMARRLLIYGKRFTEPEDIQDFIKIPKFLKNLKITL